MDKLKVGKLKELLKRYDDDMIISFKIKDSFSRYGESAELITGKSYGKDVNDITDEWLGIKTDKHLTVEFGLKSKGDKLSKIIYRT